MLQEITEKAREQSQYIKYLRARSDYYPQIIIDECVEGRVMHLSASTLVRTCFEGKWYVWHVVENVFCESKDVETINTLHLRIHYSVTMVIHLGKFNEFLELDVDQRSEIERLLDRYHNITQTKRIES